MPRDHRQKLDDGGFDDWLLQLYRDGTSPSVIDTAVPGGFERWKVHLQPKYPDIEPERLRNRDAHLLKLYHSKASMSTIERYMPGGYHRCIAILEPVHLEIEARRALQDAELLKHYRAGVTSVDLDKYLRGGHQRCRDLFAQRPEIREERVKNQKAMVNGDKQQK